MSSAKVAKEVAEAEFERLCRASRVELDDMSEEETKSLDDIKQPILRGIMRGRLTIDDKGIAHYTPPVENATPLVFTKFDGSVLMIARDNKSNGVRDSAGVIAEMTGQPVAKVAKMHLADLKFCGNLVALFLAAE